MLGRDRSYFVKTNLWFYQKVLWNWYHQHARVFDWQHICYAWLTCFSTQSAYISLLLKKIEKKLARSFNFTFRHIDDVLSLNNSRFGDFVDRIYSIELDIRIPQIQIGLLHTLTYTSELYNKRYDFNFLMWTLHLYIARFQQHLHMEYISLSWYDIPELVVHIRISLIDVAANKEATEPMAPLN